MPITRIVRLRHPGVLHDFSWPAELPDFGRYNLIYGWNGSGKTTISRLLRALEMRTAPSSGEVTLRINGAAVSSTAFGDATLPVRVFNRDFIAESVFPVGGGDVPPILVVGKESVEKQKQIEQLKQRLADNSAALAHSNSETEQATKALDKHCIDRASAIRDTLRSSGSNRYNNYDKSDFRRRATGMLEDSDGQSHRLGASERDTLLTQHRASPKPELQALAYQLPALDASAKTVSDLLSTTVVSAAIQALKDDPVLSAWLRQGVGLHQDRHAEDCLFCDQPLPSARLEKLEAHFSAEFQGFLDSLDAEIRQLSDAVQAAADLALPKRVEFYEDLAGEYDSAAAALRGARESATRFLDSLVQALTDKKALPFERLALTVSVPPKDERAVTGLDEVIRKHNQATIDFDARISRARQRLEEDSIARSLDDFRRLTKAVADTERQVTAARDEEARLIPEITRFEDDILEHRQPAEELNADLRKYLGHSDLLLAVKDAGYTISRNGVPAKSLSEGETTALALLYFLKALADKRFDLAEGVVVLDDPISSLDANAMYLAFGFIRERTKDAAQLFILTHNFTFFRQVRNWFHHLKGQGKRDISQRPARFYMLDCLSDRDPRCSTIRPLDPLLEQFESEYHYLFHCIYRSATASAPTGLEESYVIPNMARRLLETFLAFRQPAQSGELWQKIQDTEFDEAKKVRILRFLHTYSHSTAIGEPEHDPSLLGEAGSVLKDLLDFIKAQDPGHYSAMVDLVKPPTGEGSTDDGIL